MKQKSELDLVHCFVCHSNEFEQIGLNQNLLDASDFHELNKKSVRFWYVLATCQTCGLSAIQTDNPCLLPTRKYDFIKYGEPTEYYPKISTILQSLKLNYGDISIHCFSNKDFQLANFLANDLGISDLNLNDYAGCSDDWLPVASSDGSKRDPIPLSRFITELQNSKKSHQIILFTRFFDHVAIHDLLQKILDLSSPTRHFVFDVNDYDRLSDLDTLEFVWNERRNLLRYSDIELILRRANLKYSIFAYESQEVSPTLTGVISERLEVSQKSNATPHKLPVQRLLDKLITLRQRWQDKLAKTHKLGVIGASHKGISLAQFILDNHVQYSLHDDKEALRGKTPPVNPPLGFQLASGFDFSDYTHIAITTTVVIAAKIIPKLRASGYTGEILDFDCQRLD
jgi:hypothetical protein